jgi:alkylated DNA repair dioxygenase AlkB
MQNKIDLNQGAWLVHEPHWINEEEAHKFFEVLYKELSWVERSIIAKGKVVQQPRLMTWAGELPYLYSGQVLDPQPTHPLLKELETRVSDFCELSFNHVVANLYRDGHDRVGFHADDEPELGYEPLIASISLGASRRFTLRHKYKSRKKSFNLKSGSLLVMGGACQHRWYHGVPANPAIQAARINLTYRHLRGAPGWRAPREEDPRLHKRQAKLQI